MKLLYLEWCDATTRDHAWTSIEEAREWADNESWIVKSVGWVIKETDKYILLSSKMGNDSVGLLVGSLLKIPKTWIIRRRDIVESYNECTVKVDLPTVEEVEEAIAKIRKGEKDAL